MSSLTKSTANMILGMTYPHTATNGLGAMTITGLKLPKTSLDPLGEIWSGIKWGIYENFNIMPTGIFLYLPDEEVVSCNFCISYAECEGNSASIAQQMQIFQDTFEQQMTLFKSAIELWLSDEDYGYIPYVNYVNCTEKPDSKKVKELINAFLEFHDLDSKGNSK